MKKGRFFILLLTVVLAVILQNTGLLNVYGIKPNLALASLVSVSFFAADLASYIFLVVAALIGLKFRASFEVDSLIMAGLSLASFVMGRRLQWKPIINNILLIGGGTILFYLLASPGFIAANSQIVIGELVYNVVLGTIIFKIFEEWSHDKINIFHN